MRAGLPSGGPAFVYGALVRRAPLAMLLAGPLLLVATLVAARRSLAVDELRFPLAWAAVLITLDGAGRLRHGRSALPAVADWIWAGAGSLLFWDLFEIVNLRLRNWWYVGVSPELVQRSIFAALSFATVLPAVRLGEAVLRARSEGPRATGGADPRSASRPLLVGAILLALALAFPRYAFGLAWLFLWPVCEGLVAWLPSAGAAPTPLQSARAGDRARVPRLLALGLLLGLVWESLNAGCVRGWVYTVPFFERPKLFEMPLPGYLGYLPFALECAAGLALLDRLAQRLSRRTALVALGTLFALHLALEASAFPKSTLSTSPPTRAPPAEVR